MVSNMKFADKIVSKEFRMMFYVHNLLAERIWGIYLNGFDMHTAKQYVVGNGEEEPLFLARLKLQLNVELIVQLGEQELLNGNVL